MTWVHDKIYAAGGERLPSTWATFTKETGITAVLHLRPTSPASFQGPAPESFLWLNMEGERQAGMEERYLAALFMKTNLEAGRSLLLHSSLRRHRIRWAYVAFRIRSGRSVRSSLREAQEKPWLAPYHTDEKAWDDFKEWIIDRGVEENLSS